MEQRQSEVETGPAVEMKIGDLPVLWNRRAVFVGNLFSLFFGNQRGTDILRREVGTIESYGGRVIPILSLIFSRGDNLLILEKKPDRTLCHYFEQTLHLNVPEVKTGSHLVYLSLLDEERRQTPEAWQLVRAVREHPAEWLDGYVTDEALVRLADLSGKQLIASLEGSRDGNNKFLLHHFLEENSLPVFDTFVAKDEEEVRSAFRKLEEKGYAKGVVKAQIGASGIGMIRIDDKNTINIPEYLFHEGPCLVQGWLQESRGIHFVGSPSVQMFIGDERVSLYDVTEQILTPNSVHEGNMAPPAYLNEEPGLKQELLRQGEMAARWLHGRGYRGTASADYHVVRRNGKVEVRICEINARITGATYPSLLARFYHPRGAWLMRNLHFTQPYEGQALLDVLDEACLLFKPNATSGILPINFNLTRDGYVGKGQFLAIGKDIAEVRYLFDCVANLESILWVYDRD